MKLQSSQLVTINPNHPLVMYEKPLVIALLVVDRSGSMATYGGAPLKAMHDFVVNLQNGPEPERIGIGVISFADHTSFDIPIQLIGGVDAASLKYSASGGTRLYGTVYDALYALLSVATMRDRMKLETKVVLTVLTDGADTESHDMLASCRILAAEARRRKWEMAVVGIGAPGSRIAKNIGFSPAEAQDLHGHAAGEPPGQPTGYDMDASEASIDATSMYTVRRTMFTVTGHVVTSAPPGARPVGPPRDTPTPR